MHGISVIIVIILILMIVVALAGLLWLFLSGLFTSVTSVVNVTSKNSIYKDSSGLLFYDDFSGPSLSSQWQSLVQNSGSIVLSNSIANFTSDANQSDSDAIIYSNTNFDGILFIQLNASFPPSQTKLYQWIGFANGTMNNPNDAVIFDNFGALWNGNFTAIACNSTGSCYYSYLDDIIDQTKWHIYKIFWDGNKVLFYIDNSLVNETYGNYVPSIPLNVSISSHASSGGEGIATPASVLVDWVAVYREETIKVGGLLPGQSIALFNENGIMLTRANFNVNNTILDVSKLTLPIKGYFKVFNVVTEPEGIFVSNVFENITGGDSYYFHSSIV